MVVVVMGREIFGISHDGLQVAEGNVCVFEQMPGSGEGGIGIGATHEGIAHQHHVDVTHNAPHSQGCARNCCFGSKDYAVTGYDVNLEGIKVRNPITSVAIIAHFLEILDLRGDQAERVKLYGGTFV